MCQFCDNIKRYEDFEKEKHYLDNTLTIVFDENTHAFILRYASDDNYYDRDEQIVYCPKCGSFLANQLDEYGNFYPKHLEHCNYLVIDDYIFINGRGVILVCRNADVNTLKLNMPMYLNGKEIYCRGIEYNLFLTNPQPVGLVFGRQIGLEDVHVGDRLYYKVDDET